MEDKNLSIDPVVDNSSQNTRHFRGRFMDMVHPSSDVKISDKTNHANEKLAKLDLKEAPSHDEYTVPLEKDFADEISSVFEPVFESHAIKKIVTEVGPAIVKNEENNNVASSIEVESEPVFLEDENTVDDFKSPFLSNVKVDKRPLGLGSSDNTGTPDWLNQFNQQELPADDSGSGELELELLAENPEPTKVTTVDSNPFKPNSESGDYHDGMQDSTKENDVITESELRNTFDIRAALQNTMVNPRYENRNQLEITEMGSPYSQAIDSQVTAPEISKSRHTPTWMWIAFCALLVLAGAAIGALLYLSGWLG